MFIFLFFSIETLAAALVRAFWQPVILWAGPHIYYKWRVYRLPCATYIAIFTGLVCGELWTSVVVLVELLED